jgi:hypothetical protein
MNAITMPGFTGDASLYRDEWTVSMPNELGWQGTNFRKRGCDSTASDPYGPSMRPMCPAHLVKSSRRAGMLRVLL